MEAGQQVGGWDFGGFVWSKNSWGRHEGTQARRHEVRGRERREGVSVGMRHGGFVSSKKECGKGTKIGVFDAPEGFLGSFGRIWWLRFVRAGAGDEEKEAPGSGGEKRYSAGA